MKRLATLVFILVLVLASFTSVAAQLPTPTPSPSQINSYELFWPVVAGKTSNDPLYFLKTLKENLRGALIFGKPQKAEYHVFVATKRILEAEKLVSNGNLKEAEKAVDGANSRLTKANKLLEDLKGQDVSSVANELNRKLDNLTIFLDYLQTKTQGKVLENLQVSDGLVDQLSTKI